MKLFMLGIIFPLILTNFVVAQSDSNTPFDLHSYSNAADIRSNHFEADIAIDMDRSTLNGRITHFLVFPRKHAHLSTLVLDTWNLAIDSVLSEDNNGRRRRVSFELGDTLSALGRALRIRLLPASTKVTIYYHSKTEFTTALSWLTVSGKQLFFTSFEPIRCREMFPIQDAPALKYTYAVRLKTNQGYMALMSADNNPTKASPDGVYQFVMSKPISPYLISVAIGDFLFTSVTQKTGIYAMPELIDSARRVIGPNMKRMFKIAESICGPYPFARFDLLFLPGAGYPGGAMENPQITFCSGFLLSGQGSYEHVIAHELAHAWAGTSVTHRNINQLFLTEGPADYLSYRILRALKGETYAYTIQYYYLQNLLLRDSANLMHVSLESNLNTRDDPEKAFNSIAYTKGAYLFQVIEDIIGLKRMNRLMKKYFGRHAASGITDAEIFEKFIRSNLTDGEFARIRFHEWRTGRGMPEGFTKSVYAVRAKTDRIFHVVDQWISAGEIMGTENDTKPWGMYDWALAILELGRSSVSGSARLRMARSLMAKVPFYRIGTAAQYELLRYCIESGHLDIEQETNYFLSGVGSGRYLNIYFLLYIGDKALAQRIFDKHASLYHPEVRDRIKKALSK